MKKGNSQKTILIILGILGVGLVLFLVYFSLKLNAIGYLIATLVGDNKTKLEPDYQNSLSEDSVKELIKEELRDRYGNEFEIVNYERANIRKCESFFLDNYSCTNVSDDSYEYDFVMKDANGVYFAVSYNDPYYETKNDKTIYYDSVYKDNYIYMKDVSENSQFESILSSMKDFIEGEGLEAEDIYYITSDYFERNNHCSLNLAINFNNDTDVTKELYEKINDYYESRLEEVLSTPYYVRIGDKQFFLQKASLVINGKDSSFYEPVNILY